MDIDKPLDDLISSQKKTAPRSSGGRPPRGGGGGNNRRDNPTPYTRPPPRSTEDKWVHDSFQDNARGRGGRAPPANVVNVAGTGAGFTGVSPRIQVVGLHYEVNPADLKGIFSQAGTLVQGPTIRYDRSGRSTGEATMEFASYQQAKIAINKFDGAMTKGQTISINLLPPVQTRPPRQEGAASTGNLLSRISGGNGASANNAPSRGARGGRGGPVRGRGGRGGARGEKRGPANAGDLDSELDSFMAGDKNNAEDVAMA